MAADVVTEQQHTATLAALVHTPPPLHTASQLLHTILSVGSDSSPAPQGQTQLLALLPPIAILALPACHA